ncbi:MAG: glycine cleavage system aminomethyltransferase GcvT [Rhodocyclaceae bacterium]|nr:MAG: glycine cleavage system aminomethyltransferase GcvT [Rhodocyclaceae bacterium]
MARQTPLHETHRAAGAKLVDFAGWDMPLHYGSQIEEHHLVRRSAGMFDVSHMLALDVTGPDARRWLQHLLANDVAKLADAGRALYSCILNAKGGVIDDLIVYYFTSQRYRIVVNAGTADGDLAWMRQTLEGFDAVIAPRRDLAIIAVQGPQAIEAVWRAIPESRAATQSLVAFQAAEVGEMLIARTGYTGEDGFEIALPANRAIATWQALREAGVKPAGLGARDTLRLEAGMCLYGQDLDAGTSPLESGVAWTVDMKTSRDFIGRSALESGSPTRRLVGLVLEERGVLRAHQTVVTSHGRGETTSGSFSPTMNCAIALARVPKDVAIGDRVEVEVRDRRLAARVVKPPFVRNGKVLV